MLLTDTCITLFNHAIAYVDALSAVAVVLIVAFVGYICVREKRRNNKKK